MSANLDELRKHVLAAEAEEVRCDGDVERGLAGSGERLAAARGNFAKAKDRLAAAESRAAEERDRQRRRAANITQKLLARRGKSREVERNAQRFIAEKITAERAKLDALLLDLALVLRKMPTAKAKTALQELSARCHIVL